MTARFTAALALLRLLVVFAVVVPGCQGWIVFPPTTVLRSRSSTVRSSKRSRPHSSSSSSRLFLLQEKENEEDQRRRMEIVRSLQTSFYKTAVDDHYHPRQELDMDSGICYNLPLWRVPWTEVPGRSNVWNVHEAQYTNLFESILHSEPPWYVGHLFLSSDAQDEPLATWDEQLGGGGGTAESRNKSEPSPASSTAAVLGTLLRIVDYRRMQDGRLLLLVQAMERFTVLDVVQELPYAIGHVQLLPDAEEVDDDCDWIHQQTEGNVGGARALAVAESFLRWHRYEFEHTMLPLPMQKNSGDLRAEDVIGSALAKVLPYAPYSQVVQVEQLRLEELPTASSTTADNNKVTTKTADYAGPTLEQRLLTGGILKSPVVDEEFDGMSADELEICLWIALNDFLKRSRKPVSPVLLGFMPPGEISWPKGFVLDKIGCSIIEEATLDHKCVQLHPDYPASRRQKRLSYAVLALLEEASTVHGLRQDLMAIPSTRERLAFCLQKFFEWGSFQ